MPNTPTGLAAPPRGRRASFLAEARALRQLVVPILLTQLAQAAMGFTDTLMAGRYGEIDLAAVALGGSLWFPCFLAMSGLLMATTPLVAQAFGAGHFSRIRQTLQQALWLALVAGAAAAWVLRSSPPLFQTMGVPEAVLPIARDYLLAVTWGLPAMAVYQVIRSCNEGLHLTRAILVVSLLGLAANILLNYVLIYGHLGFPVLGGVGCGWATAAVMWLQCLLLTGHSLRSPAYARIRVWRHWRRPYLRRQWELISLGVPIGISIFIEASMFAVIALFLAPLGATAIAAHQITLSFTTLIFMLPLSLAMALTIRTGFALGTGDPHQARRSAAIGLTLALVLSTLTATLTILFSDAIAGLYSASEEVVTLATTLLTLAAIFQFSDALQITAAGALRGYKDTRFPLLVALVAYWLLGMPLGYLLGLTDRLRPALGAPGFWIALIVGLSLGAVLMGWRLHRITRRAVSVRPL